MMALALAELHDRQRTTKRPSGRPPLATSRTWSAVRSALGWAGRPCQPGHQSPTMARWSATTRRRRSRSLASVCRSGRRAALRLSTSCWQSRHLVLPRTVRLQSMHGRMRRLIGGACACGRGSGGSVGRVGSGRRTRRGACTRCSALGLGGGVRRGCRCSCSPLPPAAGQGGEWHPGALASPGPYPDHGRAPVGADPDHGDVVEGGPGAGNSAAVG
jgi:hypothetical protein